MQHSLSQKQLALNAGITPAYLGLVERGQRNATVAIIERICHTLHISLAEFFAPAESTPEQDAMDDRILVQLTGLSQEEKEICLQLMKDVLRLRKLAIQSDHRQSTA